MARKPRPRRPAAVAEKPLRDLAAIIRSKNAGPFRVTFDILFDTPGAFRAVVDSGVITRERIAALYGVPLSQVSSLHVFAMANAIKVTLVRPIAQCAIGETDVYGAQQHAPLMDIPVPVGGER